MADHSAAERMALYPSGSTGVAETHEKVPSSVRMKDSVLRPLETRSAGRRLAVMHKLRSVPSTLLWVFSLASCDASYEPDDAGVGSLARIRTDDGVIVEFVEASGTLLVSETAPIDSPSPLTYFLTRAEASPLELYLALAPGSAPPAELVSLHDELASVGAFDSAPRQLELPGAEFRALYETYGAVDCTYASDHAWFQSTWMSLDWTWRWYHSGDKETAGSALEKFTPWKNTANFYTHVCNYDVEDDYGDTISHDIYRDGNHLAQDSVELGYRHTYWSSLATAFDYRARAYLLPSATGRFRLGAFAP